jgi:hypothetical protein
VNQNFLPTFAGDFDDSTFAGDFDDSTFAGGFVFAALSPYVN